MGFLASIAPPNATLDLGELTLDLIRLVRSSLQTHAHPKRMEPSLKYPEMLLGENFRRRHQRHVESAFNGHEGAASRYHRFARAHVALNKAPHRRVVRHVVAQLTQDAGLRARKRKPELVQKGLDEVIIAATWQAARR